MSGRPLAALATRAPAPLAALATIVALALGAVLAAALDLAVATVQHGWRRTFGRDQQREDAAARVLGYRGPVDAGGRWRNDLAAGRVDHWGWPADSAPPPPAETRQTESAPERRGGCGCGKRRGGDA